MQRLTVMRLAGVLLLCATAGCPAPTSSGAPRIVIRPALQDEVDGPVLVGALWIPGLESTGFESNLMDIVRLDEEDLPRPAAVGQPTEGRDESWSPREIPTEASLRCLAAEDCGTRVALGLVVAVFDRDADGVAAIEAPDPVGAWDLTSFAAVGQDAIVGLATDYVVAYASADLQEQQASLLGWPIAQGVHVMRVERDGQQVSLEPVAKRERVPVFLISTDPDGEHLGCCSESQCAGPPIACPDVSRIE